MEKCPAGTAFEVTLEGRRPFLAFERRCRPNLPRIEFGRVRNSARIVLRQALFQIGRDTGVNLLRMGKGLQNVNVMEIVHQFSPPSRFALWRVAFAVSGEPVRGSSKIRRRKPVAGLEPATHALRKHCSTTELNWRPVRLQLSPVRPP